MRLNLISEIQSLTVSSNYLTRIGNLIRDARRHGLTQNQLAESLGTSQSAVNRIEQGHQNLSLEMLARIGEALDSEIVSLGAGPHAPAGRRRPRRCPARSTSRPRKNAGVALLCASLLNRGRTTLRRVARIEEVNRLLEVLDQHRRADPLAQRRATTSRSSRRPSSTSTRIDVDGRPPYPLGHHVPRPAAAPRRTPSSCRTPAAATSAPAPSSRTCPRCARSASRSRRPTGSYHAHRRPRRSRPTRPIVLTERGDTVTENALHGRRPPRRRHRDPQRQPQLHGPGPLLLPAEARRARSTASAPPR